MLIVLLCSFQAIKPADDGRKSPTLSEALNGLEEDQPWYDGTENGGRYDDDDQAMGAACYASGQNPQYYGSTRTAYEHQQAYPTSPSYHQAMPNPHNDQDLMRAVPAPHPAQPASFPQYLRPGYPISDRMEVPATDPLAVVVHNPQAAIVPASNQSLTQTVALFSQEHPLASRAVVAGTSLAAITWFGNRCGDALGALTGAITDRLGFTGTLVAGAAALVVASGKAPDLARTVSHYFEEDPYTTSRKRLQQSGLCRRSLRERQGFAGYQKFIVESVAQFDDITTRFDAIYTISRMPEFATALAKVNRCVNPYLKMIHSKAYLLALMLKLQEEGVLIKEHRLLKHGQENTFTISDSRSHYSDSNVFVAKRLCTLADDLNWGDLHHFCMYINNEFFGLPTHDQRKFINLLTGQEFKMEETPCCSGILNHINLRLS